MPNSNAWRKARQKALRDVLGLEQSHPIPDDRQEKVNKLLEENREAMDNHEKGKHAKRGKHRKDK